MFYWKVIHNYTCVFFSSKVGDIKSFRGYFINFRQQCPRPLNDLLLEVVTEGPVAQHLEEGVMVDILADVVQVVVLAAGSDTLLGVDGSLPLGHVAVGVHGAHEDGLELVHARIGEQEGRVVQGNGGGGVDVDMLML